MKRTGSKTPLVIAAVATAITLASFGQASAQTYSPQQGGIAAEVIDANFKFKKGSRAIHRGQKVTRHRSISNRARHNGRYNSRRDFDRNHRFDTRKGETGLDRENRRNDLRLQIPRK